MTFGYTIYWRDELDESRPDDLVKLIHELVHVDQVRRNGGESAFACEYGRGYIVGGGQLPAYIDDVTAYHRNPLEAEAYNFDAQFRDDAGCADRVPTASRLTRLPAYRRGMSVESNPPSVLQLRLVVEADDFDAALAFYRDQLGLAEQAAFESGDDARVVILDAGRATLELCNPAQKDMIDAIEVGHPASPRIRVAFEVSDTAGTTTRLVDAGATLIGAPVETPWRSLNA